MLTYINIYEQVTNLHVINERKYGKHNMINQYEDHIGKNHTGKYIYTSIYNRFHKTENSFDKNSYSNVNLPSIPPLHKELNQQITQGEVRQAINSLKLTSSSGLGGVYPQWYIATKKMLIPIITEVYNEIWTRSIVPKQVCEIEGIQNFKKSGGQSRI